mgnify:CR=1 FL=1
MPLCVRRRTLLPQLANRVVRRDRPSIGCRWWVERSRDRQLFRTIIRSLSTTSELGVATLTDHAHESHPPRALTYAGEVRSRPTLSWSPGPDVLSLAPGTTDVAPVVDVVRAGGVVVLSGAGISTESGIPDYRGYMEIGRASCRERV